MLGVVLLKEGVRFDVIAPGGFRILSAIELTARKLGRNITITCACEGHPPTDPHTQGKAYDIRSHDFDEATKPVVLNCLQALLPADQFYIFLEDPNTDNEHWHAQVKKGTTYP